jgi:hypothetical protein
MKQGDYAVGKTDNSHPMSQVPLNLCPNQQRKLPPAPGTARPDFFNVGA